MRSPVGHLKMIRAKREYTNEMAKALAWIANNQATLRPAALKGQSSYVLGWEVLHRGVSYYSSLPQDAVKYASEGRSNPHFVGWTPVTMDVFDRVDRQFRAGRSG